MCVDVVDLIYVNKLDSSKREHRHALSDMLFCAFFDYKNKTLQMRFEVKNHGTSHMFCAFLGGIDSKGSNPFAPSYIYSGQQATQAMPVEERTTKKAKSGPMKTAKSVEMSKK